MRPILFNYSSCAPSNCVEDAQEENNAAETVYLSYQDALKEAAFGTPRTELLGLKQFVSNIETQMQSYDFPEKADQSRSGQVMVMLAERFTKLKTENAVRKNIQHTSFMTKEAPFVEAYN